MWEEEASSEPRLRRKNQSVPRSGSRLPSMPLDFQDPDDDEDPRPRKRFAYGESSAPWWQPSSTLGRFGLTLGALLVLTTLIAAVVLFKVYLQRDSRFRIVGASSIQADGLTEVSRADMLPVFGEDIGRNIFFIPLNERRKQLESIPWIEHATVMRILPDQLRVSVVERQPVAFTRQGSQIGLVDASGVLLSMPASAMAKHHYSFPVVTGMDAQDAPDARQTRMAVYLRFLSDLNSAGKNYSDQISEIDLTDPEDARVLMPEQGTDILAHFGEDHFLERFQRYQAHIAEWRQQYPKLSSVDLRYDQQAVLKMDSGQQDATADPAAKATPDATAASKPEAATLATPAQTDPQPLAKAPAKPMPVKVDSSAKPIATTKAVAATRTAATTKSAPSLKAISTRRPSAKANKAALAKKKQASMRRAALKAQRRKSASKTPPVAPVVRLHPSGVMAQGGN